jgi:hypothetical protein
VDGLGERGSFESLPAWAMVAPKPNHRLASAGVFGGCLQSGPRPVKESGPCGEAAPPRQAGRAGKSDLRIEVTFKLQSQSIRDRGRIQDSYAKAVVSGPSASTLPYPVLVHGRARMHLSLPKCSAARRNGNSQAEELLANPQIDSA